MGAPVFVADGALLVSAGGLFCFMPLRGAGAGECARRRSNFLLLRHRMAGPKKVTKEKATPLSASLRFASGNLRCSRPAGSRSNSLRCASLRQSRALIRWPLRSSAHTEGMGSKHPLGPSLRSAPLRGRKRLALGAVVAGPSAATARADVWMFGCPPPAGCALRKALAPTTKGRAKQWPEVLFGCLAPPSPLYAPRSAAASGSGLAIV